MKRLRLSAPHVRLAVAFLVLVVAPSFLLGWMSLRAVENERRAQHRRMRENSERYARFAARAVRQELVELEATWQDLWPEGSGEAAWSELAAALDARALAARSLRSVHWLAADGWHASADGRGAARRPMPPMPGPSELRDFRVATARAEADEFDRDDPRAAMVEYRGLLERIRNPRLRAAALAALGRTALQAGDWQAAIAAGRELVREHPGSADLDSQPLDLVARWQTARALESSGDLEAAAGELLQLAALLASREPELVPAQDEFFRERCAGALARLAAAVGEPRGRGLADAAAALRERSKTPTDDSFLVRKLERKLERAIHDEQRPARRWRYVSDVAEGRPYLLAYAFLPGRTAAEIGALLGFIVDVPRLSTAILPEFLHEIELTEDLQLEITDEAGRHVTGAQPTGEEAPLGRTRLSEPFEFWSVTVHARGSETAARAIDIRTEVFLYGIGILLVTIAAGAVLITLGLRREGRLANLKTTFVSSVSHELRTPLTSIRMYAEMLEMGAERIPEAERRRQLGIIRSECGRLERLIDAVLDLASLSRGTKRLRLEYEEIGALVQAVAESFREQAESAGFSYTIEVDADLPEMQVEADAIRQVLLNLLSNAVKYSEAERWIAVRAVRRGGEVALQVEDHGIGIDLAEQERIFEDFYRIDQRLASGKQGVGLGLTVVRGLVALHGGRVTVESALGRGACFTVWLPIEPSPASGAPRPEGRVSQEA